MRWRDRSVQFEEGHAIPEKLLQLTANATEPYSAVSGINFSSARLLEFVSLAKQARDELETMFSLDTQAIESDRKSGWD